LTSLAAKLNKGIWQFYRNALGAFFFQPAQWGRILRLLGIQRRAARRRQDAGRSGAHIPPYLIISVTRQCNLSCKGCYVKAQHGDTDCDELTIGEWARVLEEARDAGVGTVIVAGGEPLVKEGLWDLLGRFPDMVFAVFTNGILLDDTSVKRIKQMTHVIPVISLEGHGEATDDRRGPGVYRAVTGAMDRLHAAGVLYGVSTTVTNVNLYATTSPGYIRELKWRGCCLIFYIEYVPFEAGTQGLQLRDAGRKVLQKRAADVARRERVLAVRFPGDEEGFGGCLAAGRGFLHIGANGAAEPCPFSPFSTLNLREISFTRALQSSFLKAIRDNRELLDESGGGCALFRNQDKVEALLRETGE